MHAQHPSATLFWLLPFFGTLTRCDADLIDLHLMGLFPMEGAWSGGEALKPAVQMGLDHINARDDILPGYRLKLVWEDTKVSNL